MSAALDALVQRFIAHHLEFHPVDATFMGIDGHDHRVPPAGDDAAEREAHALRDLERDAVALPGGATSAERLETLMLRGALQHARRELEERPRFTNPAWYTGEAAFAIVSLLLPRDATRDDDTADADARRDDLRARLDAIPAFLAAGARRLDGRAAPADWVRRARLECDAARALLERGLPLHPLWTDALRASAGAAANAFAAFSAALERVNGDADPASGEAYLDFIVRDVHAFEFSSREADALAWDGFRQARDELDALAASVDPARSWREQLAALELEHPASVADVIPTYEAWQARAVDAASAAGLVTPAREYDLRFLTLPAWAREVAGPLYFLFYRSPAANRAGRGSAYWVFPPGADEGAYLRAQNTATIKITHVVHHGSIGHHTQNWRARASTVRLARLAGTDCASGIAFLGGGSMVEGWACYAQDLMLEADGFYTAAERVLLKQMEMRNAASCLVDLRVHSGRWSLEDARRFYADDAGFAPSRVWSETTRNSIFPGTRCMYWLGTREIKRLRAELRLEPRAFHDALLAFGSAPVTAVARELRAEHHARA